MDSRPKLIDAYPPPLPARLPRSAPHARKGPIRTRKGRIHRPHPAPGGLVPSLSISANNQRGI
eukprot:5370793-Pyramimonas_sp.AAC.1